MQTEWQWCDDVWKLKWRACSQIYERKQCSVKNENSHTDENLQPMIARKLQIRHITLYILTIPQSLAQTIVFKPKIDQGKTVCTA